MIRHDVDQYAEARLVGSITGSAKALFATPLRVDERVIDHVVAMVRSRLSFEDRRQVDPVGPESLEIVHSLRSILQCER
jgi:hypothetical protein